MKKLQWMLLFLCGMVFPSVVGASLSPQRSVLGNGLVLLTSEQNSLPMVTLSLLIDAGSRLDSKGHGGLGNLTSRLLTYGTRQRTALQISDALDFIGAEFSTSCSEEQVTVNLTVLKKDLETGLSLLGEILTVSTFPPEEIERQKQSVIASIKAKGEQPGEVAEIKFLDALFPGSPYGRPVEGTEDSVKAIERTNLVEFYERYYRPGRAILAVVGDISHREVMEKLSKSFEGWKKGAPVKTVPSFPPPGPVKWLQINKDLVQANIILGHEGIPRNHPDYYAIQVMNYILGGGGFSSRMTDSIRNERGLAYSVYSMFQAEKYAGTFQIVMQTKNESAGQAIRIAMEEIRRMQNQGVSAEELEEAKSFLVGSFPLRLDTNRKIVNFLAQEEFYGLGLDYPERYPQLIQRVSREDVLRTAKLYLKPENLIVVVVANQEKAKINKATFPSDPAR